MNWYINSLKTDPDNKLAPNEKIPGVIMQQGYGFRARVIENNNISKIDVSTSDMFKLRVGPLKATNFYARSNEMEVVVWGEGIWKYVDSKCR